MWLVLLVLVLRPDLLEPRWGFNSCRSAFIEVYCVVVFTTSCYRTALSLVTADTMLSMSPLKESINSSARMASGGGTWARLVGAAGCTVSPLCDILWIFAAALAEPKESAEGLEFRMTRLSASCASWKWDLHFYQVRSSQGNPLNLGRSSGKFFSARRERDATETSHAYKVAGKARLAFHCVSLQRVINYETIGSSTYQDNIPCWSPVTSIASPPVLVAPR